MAYHNLVFARWPNREIVGVGRWAVIALDSPDRIWLYETREEAEHQILDHRRVKVVDLLVPVPAPRYFGRSLADEMEPDDD